MTLTAFHAFVLPSGVSVLHVAAAGSDILINTTYEAGHSFATPIDHPAAEPVRIVRPGCLHVRASGWITNKLRRR